MRLTVAPIQTFPTDIKYHAISRVLEVRFDDGQTFELPCEYLRVYTPSAEAVGHGPGQEVLQLNKEEITIMDIQPVGNYGIAPTFSDGHNSGIYTWALLYKLGVEYDVLWETYLNAVLAAGHQRNVNPVH